MYPWLAAERSSASTDGTAFTVAQAQDRLWSQHPICIVLNILLLTRPPGDPHPSPQSLPSACLALWSISDVIAAATTALQLAGRVAKISMSQSEQVLASRLDQSKFPSASVRAVGV